MIEGQISRSELLVSDEHAVVAPVEDQIRVESTRTVIHEDARLLVAGATLNHFKDDVLQAGGLSNLPVNTGSASSRHGCNVNDKIAYLAIKIILIRVPIITVRVWVRIDDGNAREAGRCFECGNTNRVADELCVIVLDDRRADEVCSRWKVHQSRGYCGGIAALTAAVAISNGSVDCCGVVRGAISSRAIVLDITEDFVGRVAERYSTLPLDVGHPVR